MHHPRKEVVKKMTNEKRELREEPTDLHPNQARILMTEFVTHDVKRFIVERPKDYDFLSGQDCLLSIPEAKWESRKEPFSFTSSENDKAIEFMIKRYSDGSGLTERLHSLVSGDTLTLYEPFGTIHYKEKGVFLAAGSGITPFMSIFRTLREKNQLKGNKLIFSNKRAEDIILEKELLYMFDDDLTLTLTREEVKGYEQGRINKELIQKYVTDMNQYFYLCGPDPFVVELRKDLIELGADKSKIVAEAIVVPAD